MTMAVGASASAGSSTLSTQDLDAVRAVVLADTAIVLDASKGYLVEARLLPVARELGVGSVPALIAHLRSGGAPLVRRRVVEALTTNETSWFRDGQPFTTLERHVVPRLLRDRAATRTLTVWSAACSSGQEPYSIAMVLRERFPGLAGWTVRVLATDVSREMCERAAAGRYTQMEVDRGLPAPMLARWFDRDGPDWVVGPELRAMVDVRQMNLAAAWAAVPTADVVFLRNVLMYFGVETRWTVLDRLRRHLRPDGALFLGTAESPLGVHDGYERVAPEPTTSWYRLRAARGEGGGAPPRS